MRGEEDGGVCSPWASFFASGAAFSYSQVFQIVPAPSELSRRREFVLPRVSQNERKDVLAHLSDHDICK